MTMVFGLGMRLHVCMRRTLENGVLHNRQQPGRAENSFIDQDEFKTPCYDKNQFCDKMTASTWTVFEILLLNIVVLT